MNNRIRKDLSSRYNPQKDPTNWNAEVMRNDLNSNRNEEAAEGTKKYWEDVEKRKTRGEGTAEEELTKRIAAIPSETSERYQRLIKEEKIRQEKEMQVEDLVRARANSKAQMEEEFVQELEELGKQIHDIRS